MIGSWWLLVLAGAILAVMVWVWRPARAAAREAQFAQARRDFHAQRERLEVKFILLAAAHTAPSGPHWADCEFDDDVAYVRNRTTKEVAAFVAVKVAIDDGDDPPTNVSGIGGNLHAGTAVFRFDRSRSRWETDGRAILYLKPAEAIRFYQDDLEMIDQELAGRA